MSDRPDAPDEIPTAEMLPARRSLIERVSVVWLVPLGALLMALGLAWQAYTDRGPLIEITFSNGEGISAGETDLTFRDIAVGRVETVGFTEGLDRVLVTVRLEQNVADYVDDGAVFWVVRPELSVEGVSGLSTVLSGIYIEGSWDSEPGGLVFRHDGLDQTPVARPDQQGKRIVLRTDSGRGLTSGAPILYRGLEVGRVGAPRIATDGISVLADAFIEAPHDQILTNRTRFWSSTGFSFTLDTSGASIDFDSLATLIRGGLVFDTVVSGGVSVPEGAAFDIYDDREQAVASLFNTVNENAPRLNMTAIFEENVAGLNIGAPVEVQGLRIGEVTDLTGVVSPERFGDERVRLIATLSIRLDELVMGEPNNLDPENVLDFLEVNVENGLRARLVNASLLTGDLKVELVEIVDAEPAALDRDADPFPIIPTAPSQVQNVAGAAQGLLARLSALPVEEVMGQIIGFLDDARQVLRQDGLTEIGGEALGLLEDARAVVGSEAVQALPDQLGSVARNLEAVLGDLQEREAAARLVEALEGASAAADGLAEAVVGVPDLVARITEVAEKAQALALEDLIAEANGLVASARGIVDNEDAQALPGALRQTLDGVGSAATEAETLLAELNTQDSARALTEALDAAARAADQVTGAAEGVPELVERITAVAAKAEALALEDLVAEASGLVTEARAIVGQPDAQTLPSRVGQTLDQLAVTIADARAVIGDLEEQGTVTALNAALDGAAAAAADVSTAVEGIDELVAELDAVARKANGLALEGLVDEAGGALADARAILSQPDAQQLPSRIAQTLDQLAVTISDARAVIQDIEDQETVTALNAALDGAAQAASDVSESVADVPALVDEMQSVAERANTLEVEALIAEITRLAEAGRLVLGTDEARALPGQLGGALEQVEAALTELRAGGTVENVNAALASARRAADQVAITAEDLPALVAQTNAVLRQAQLSLAQLDQQGALNREARAALREVARAAEAVRSLSRAIERRPNSILTGR
ncbi:MAG: MlaD family protein [Pseudomonadota bacterium]